jgi:hypothetical protein
MIRYEINRKNFKCSNVVFFFVFLAVSRMQMKKDRDDYIDVSMNHVGTWHKSNFKKEIRIPLCVKGRYYLENDRYLLDNVPWDIYPVGFLANGVVLKK